jgi:hypothetical protein
MEVTVTEFRKNIGKYFDKVYFEKEPIILRKRGYKVKLTCEIDDINAQDESNFDNAVKSKEVKNKLSVLASKL